MRRIVILLLAVGCTRSDREADARRALNNAESSGLEQCVPYHGKYGTVVFCVDGSRISVCTPSGCVATTTEPR